MATTASLPITVWRNDDVYELPLRVRGLDLANVALAMQIRMHGDASGPALIDLAKVTNGNAEALGTDWQRPLLLNGTLRFWSVGGRIYTKPGANPANETDGSLLIQRVAVPETATSPGIEGQSAWDASYHYLCTGANQWRRVAIATW
ncbi:hypothetical protein [Sphingomonas sp. Leaf4]|uniref:hypothetical protein n=1 Tax=Sphingomonas sp. Leaf4 TaxID=2876553 RepID=UPI001E551F24|nr:hypothetical protein [Sphingomonas sp. Leaf4]